MNNINYKRSIVSAFFTAMYLFIIELNFNDNRLLLANLIGQLSGAYGEIPVGFSAVELMELSRTFFPSFIVILMWGNDLYSLFCTASVYIFSRCNNKTRWFKKSIYILLTEIVIYEILYTSIIVLVSSLIYYIKFDLGGIIMWIYHILLHSMWICICVLGINIISVYYGSTYSYICVYGIQGLLFTLIAISYELVNVLGSNISNMIIRLNPISCIILCWHNWDKYYVFYDLYEIQALKPFCSLLYLLALTIITIYWSHKKLIAKDIIYNSIEENT